MITKIIDEQPFQVLTNNFSISPSVTGYELQISADGIDYTTLFTVNANTTRMVTGVAANSYYRLLGNEGEVVVNWQKVCVTGGGGDLSNYYTKSETDAAIDAATENFVTSAETEQQIIDAIAASGGTADLYDRYKKVVYNVDDSYDYEAAFFQTSADGDFPASTLELYTATVPPTFINVMGDLDYDPYTGVIDRENQTITFENIPAGTYSMILHKQESDESEPLTFPVLFGCPNEEYEQYDVTTTGDEAIEELNRTYNTPFGDFVYAVPNLETFTWTFVRDVDTFVLNYSEGSLQIETDYKPTAEELIGGDLIGSEGSVQDALENAGIFVDGVGVTNVPNMIEDAVADVVDTFSGITSGLSAELSTVERVTSTAINSLRTDVNTISGATANVVTSAYGSGHNVTAIWQGTQDDYNMLTQSGATADATTFYIIKNNPSQ